jgi:hypothetical protein
MLRVASLMLAVVMWSGTKNLAAQTVTVPSTVEWFDTGIDLRAGVVFRLSIVATGTWTNTPGGQAVDAAGFGALRLSGALAPSEPFAGLIGRVGTTVFNVGTSFRGRSPAAGRLFLAMNDVPGTFADNTGSLTVVVSQRVNSTITTFQDPVLFLELQSADPTPFSTPPTFRWVLRNRIRPPISGEFIVLLDGVVSSAISPGLPSVQNLAANSEVGGEFTLNTGTPPHLNAGDHTITLQLRAYTPTHDLLVEANAYVHAFVPPPEPVSPLPTCPVGQAGAPITLSLTRSGTGSDGALLFVGSTTTLPSSCTNRADALEIIGSPVPVLIAELGKPDACLSSIVILGPNLTPGAKVRTSAADMAKVFGEPHPKLPLNVIACVNGGGSAPNSLSLSLSYTTAAN